MQGGGEVSVWLKRGKQMAGDGRKRWWFQGRVVVSGRRGRWELARMLLLQHREELLGLENP